VFTTSTVLPLEVPLTGDLAHAGALLRDGNTVHIHGRLVQYRYRMAVRTTPNPSDRKSMGEVLEAIAAATRDRLSHWTTPPTATKLAEEIHKAQQRALTVIKPTIEVGYVELRQGSELGDAEVAELIAHWRPRPPADHSTPRAPTAPPAPHTAADALDTAMAAAFPSEPAHTAAPTALGKPRRRLRGESATVTDAEANVDGVAEDGDAA
jgi:hypothetical protein